MFLFRGPDNITASAGFAETIICCYLSIYVEKADDKTVEETNDKAVDETDDETVEETDDKTAAEADNNIVEEFDNKSRGN